MQEEVVPLSLEAKRAPESVAPTLSNVCKLSLDQTFVVESTDIGDGEKGRRPIA